MCTKEYNLAIVKRLLGKTRFIYMNGNVQKVKRYELNTGIGQLTIYTEARDKIVLKEETLEDVDLNDVYNAIEVMYKRKIAI